MQVTQAIVPFYVGFNSNTSEDVHETYEDITVTYYKCLAKFKKGEFDTPY